MACPFFMPTHKYEDGTWLHPFRLPLGGGWKGYCTAPGREGEVPSPEQLHHACNLGYARSCGRDICSQYQHFGNYRGRNVHRDSDRNCRIGQS